MVTNQSGRHLATRHLFDQRMEGLVELIHRLGPIGFTCCNRIETLLGMCGKVIAQDGRELLHQKVVGDTSQVGWHQFSGVGAHDLAFLLVADLAVLQCQYVIGAFHTFYIAVLHILARLDRVNSRLVGGWTTNALILHLFDQRTLAIAHRWFGERFLAMHHCQLACHLLLQLCNGRGGVACCYLFVRRLGVRTHKSVEGHYLVRSCP